MTSKFRAVARVSASDDDDPDASHDIEGEVIWRERARAYDSQYKGPAHWRRALNVLAATGSLALACREVMIGRNAFQNRRERYPEFAEAVDAAIDYFREFTLETTAMTRAVDGVLEPVFYKGDVVGHVRKYSDALMNKLLEANHPEKFRSKTENAGGKTTVIIKGGLPDPNAPAEDDSDIPITGGRVPVGG